MVRTPAAAPPVQPGDDQHRGSVVRRLAGAVRTFSAQPLLKNLTKMQPSTPRTFIAARAAVCFAAAIEIGMLSGHTALGLVAGLGTFTAQYAPRRSTSQRAFILPLVAVLLAVNVAVGASVAQYRWAAPAVVAAAALVMTCLCDIAKLPQPGMPMFVLVCAIATRLPPGHVGEYVSVMLCAGLATSAVALSGLMFTRVPFRQAAVGTAGDGGAGDPTCVAAPAPARTLHHRSVTERLREHLDWLPPFARSPTVRTARRAAGAVLAAGMLANLAGLPRPYWAMFAAASLMGHGSYTTTVTERALHRFVGTAIGVVIAGIAVSLHPTDTVLVVVLAAFMFLGVFTITRNFALGLLFITPLALLLTNAAGQAQDVFPLAEQRLVETALGCVVGFVAAYAVSARWVERQLRISLAGTTQAMAAQLTQHGDSPDRLRSLEQWARRLEVIGQRGADERPGVRTAVEPYARSLAATEQLAKIVIESARNGGSASSQVRPISAGHDIGLGESVCNLAETLSAEFQID